MYRWRTVPAPDFEDRNVLFLLADSPKSATWETKGQKGWNPKPSAFYNFAYLLFCHPPVLPTPHPPPCDPTFTVQFLSTNKLGDLRSRCTIIGLHLCK